MKQIKKLITAMLVFAMFLTIIHIATPQIKEVQAEESSEVDLGVLSVKVQLRENSDSYDLRLITSLDSLNYKNAGFRISIDSDGDGIITESEMVTSWSTQKVVSRIDATTSKSGFVYNYSPKVIDVESEYFVTGIIKGISKEHNMDFLVESFYTTLDGTVVEGQNRWFSIDDMVGDSINNRINVPVKMSQSEFSAVETTKTATINTTSCTINESYYDGRYGHFSLEVDKLGLPSASEVEIGGKTVIYRNLYTQGKGNADKTADKTFYDLYKSSGDKFIIATAADLYAFRWAVENYGLGQTFYLVSDIELNDVDKVEWETGIADEGYTPTEWPAGYFKGTFDGQMHTISGLYQSNSAGMFAKIYNTTVVENFKLVDSYIATTSSGVGSIAAQCNGATIDTVYSEATISTSNTRAGGMVGYIDATGSVIRNCQYAGAIYANKAGTDLRVGGILGENYKNSGSSIIACLFNGQIVANNLPTDTVDLRIGGILGFEDTNTIPIDNCLSIGSISVSSTATANVYTGSIVGRGTNKANAKPTNTYGAKETWNASTSWWGYNNPIVDGQLSLREMYGASGYIYNTMTLDTNYWSYVKGGVPELKNFQQGEEIQLNEADKMDTSWYTSTENGMVYTLDSASEAFGFVELGKTYDFAGQTINLGANIELKDATWTPIKSFAGTFDGQMKTISGMHVNENEDGVGMFSAIASGATVQNLKLVDSYIEGNSYVGSIAGTTQGNINTVYSNAIVVSAGKRIGGIVGMLKASPVTIQNSWFDGILYANSTGTDLRVGGIVGDNGKSDRANIIACLFSGDIHVEKVASGAIDLRVGGILGFEDSYTTPINNTLSVGTIIAASPSTDNHYTGSIVGRGTNKANAKPSNTYAATETWSTCTSWWGYNNPITDGQLALADMYGGSGYIYGTMTLSSEYWAYVYGGTPELRCFQTGVEISLSDADKVDTSWYTSEDSGVTYTLTTTGQLLGFSQLGATKTFAGQTIKLGADMDLKDALWTPIVQFSGVFNGDGKTIKNLYIKSDVDRVGMFKQVNAGASVQNFRLVDSYVEGKEVVGSIVARAKGNVDTIYSNATIVSHGPYNGGIVAQTWDTAITINNCWYDGSMDIQSDIIVCSGGILGENRATTVNITNCLYSGYIKTISQKYRLFLGGINGTTGIQTNGTTTDTSAKTFINGCISTGDFETKSANNVEVAAILGVSCDNGNASTTNVEITNCYAMKESWPYAFSYIERKGTTEGILPVAEMKDDQLNNLNMAYWAYIQNGTPELRSFMKGKEYVEPNAQIKSANVGYGDTLQLF